MWHVYHVIISHLGAKRTIRLSFVRTGLVGLLRVAHAQRDVIVLHVRELLISVHNFVHDFVMFAVFERHSSCNLTTTTTISMSFICMAINESYSIAKAF